MMSSPNVRVANLRQSSTYQVILPAYRDAWLDTCTKLPETHCLPPPDGQIFDSLPGESMTGKILNRLNDYGLVAGCEFVCSKNRLPKSLEFSCKHHGVEKLNRHKIQ